MGFGDDIPKRVLGRQPYRNPCNPKIAKRFKRSVNQGAKRPLIPLTLLKNCREAKMGFGDNIPKQVWDWSHAPAVRGVQHDGNRKSQRAPARSRSGRVCRRQRTAPLCEFPGSAAQTYPHSPFSLIPLPNRAKPYINQPSGFASLPDFFFLNRFAIGERWGISSPKPPAWGRVPRPLLRFALMARFFENKHKNPPAASS